MGLMAGRGGIVGSKPMGLSLGMDHRTSNRNILTMGLRARILSRVSKLTRNRKVSCMKKDLQPSNLPASPV